MRAHVKKTPPEIHFMYLDNMEIYILFKNAVQSVFIFQKFPVFYNFIFSCSSNMFLLNSAQTLNSNPVVWTLICRSVCDAGTRSGVKQFFEILGLTQILTLRSKLSRGWLSSDLQISWHVWVRDTEWNYGEYGDKFLQFMYHFWKQQINWMKPEAGSCCSLSS